MRSSHKLLTILVRTTGQRANTRSRSVIDGVQERIDKFARRYRAAYGALLRLDPSGDWSTTYLELRDCDNRGPGKEIEETQWALVSRTQVLLTKIVQLCKEIRDIEKTIKMNNIVPRLPESTINTNRNKDNSDDRGTDDQGEKGCSNSSHNSPSLHESDLSYSINMPQASEEHPTQTLSSLTPDALYPSLSSSPTSSELTESPFKLSSSDNSESLSCAQ
jgi:hypothetical protein